MTNPAPEESGAEATLTLGQRLADHVAAIVGSWPFIIVQTILLILWIVANVWLAWRAADPNRAWDPYPFILLNLLLSFQAAYTGPVVMMSQNRQAEKDRMTAQNDFDIDRQAEGEIQSIMTHLAEQDKRLLEAMERLDEMRGKDHDRLLDQFAAILKRMEQADRRVLDLLKAMETLHPEFIMDDHEDFPPHDHE